VSFLFILLIAGFVTSFVISVCFWLLKPTGNIYITSTKYGINLCFMALIVWQISSTKLGYAVIGKALKPLGFELSQTAAKSEKVTDKITNTNKNSVADNAKTKTKEKTKYQNKTSNQNKTVNKQNTQNKQVSKKPNKSAEKQAEEQSAKEAEEQLRRFNEQLKAQKQRKQQK